MTGAPLEMLLQRELPIAARGCTQSYGRIVSGCQNTVTAIALAITRDVQASEDIAQEVFLKAWQQLHRLNNHASFLPWLRQITRNLARDWLRANRRRPLTGEAAEIAIGMAADPSPSPAQRLLRLEEECVAEDIISALPEDSRETLLLYYREGQSSQQVAALLGLSDAAVRKRLSRARASVREELMQRFGTFARSSAPGTAFAATVSSLLMVAAPGTANAIIVGSGMAGASAGAGKLGAGGLGASSAGGGAALGSLGAAVEAYLSDTFHLGLTLACVTVGVASAYLGGLYLLRFAGNETERAQVRRLVRLQTFSSAVFCMATLAAVALRLDSLYVAAVLLGGMGMINYQYLVIQPRVMGPMLARDAARHGRSGPTWIYRSMFGRGAVAATTLFAVAAVLYVFLR